MKSFFSIKMIVRGSHEHTRACVHVCMCACVHVCMQYQRDSPSDAQPAMHANV